MDMAGLEFNVKDALNVLKMYADAGRDRIQAKDLLQQCMPLIENWQERYEKLETIKENHQYCNYRIRCLDEGQPPDSVQLEGQRVHHPQRKEGGPSGYLQVLDGAQVALKMVAYSWNWLR